MAFIFPLGAYVSACYNVSKTMGILVTSYIGLTLYVALLPLWLSASARTLAYVLRSTGVREKGMGIGCEPSL